MSPLRHLSHSLSAALVVAFPLNAISHAETSTVAIYDLEGVISENGISSGSMFSMDLDARRPLTFFDLATSLQKAAADPDVAALVMEADDAVLSMAQSEEIRRHLLAARTAGKDVWLYSDHYHNQSALLGSAATHFSLNPEADVNFTGMLVESLYFKDMLDKIGVLADVIHIGDFKSFGEEFYRRGPSEFAARQTETLISDLFTRVTQKIAAGRDISAKKVVEYIDRGHFTANEAREAGFVNQLTSRTAFNRSVRTSYPDADFDHGYELPERDGPKIDGFLDVFKLMLDSGKSDSGKSPYVAVVALDGAISKMSITPVRDEIIRLMRDDNAAALVLRVNSPGGSALASEILWETTDQWRASGRPLAVSMGGVAASGGYYVAASADRIFAENTTLTGSIGVVGMKFVMADAMDKLGITTHTTQRGEYANLMSMTQPFDEAQEKLVRHSMREVYGTFKKRIQDGRGDRLQNDLEALAGGRVYTGKRALKHGLIDELGGITDAIDWAAKQANLETPRAKLFPEPQSPLEGMFSTPEREPEDELVRTSPQPGIDSHLRRHFQQVGIESLPLPAREAAASALQRIRAAQDSTIQLIGPTHMIQW